MADERGRGPIQPVGKGSETPDLEQELLHLIGQEEKLSKEVEQEKKPVRSEVLQEISRNLPRLIQKTLQKIDANQVYQTFKLPGTDYVVHDRREQKAEESTKEKGKEKEIHPDKARAITQESKMSLEELLVQKGKYPNYFADPAKKMLLPEQRVAEERLQKLFTRFEKALLQRFEQGAEMGKKLQNGHPSFLKKTTDQWREFFSHFTKRTVKRQVPLEQVQELTFRGLVKKEARATVISDMALTNGQIEKFVRFRLSLAAQNLMERLAVLEPGVKLAPADLVEHLAEELEYLAIKNASPEITWAQAPQQGKFLGRAQTEEKVAQDLGLQMRGQFQEKQKGLNKLKGNKKGFGFGSSGEEEAQPDSNFVFVPWWQRAFVKPTGPVRWFVMMTYIVVLALLFFAVWSIVHSP